MLKKAKKQVVIEDETPVTPAEEKTIIFYDDELTAVQLEGGDIYVPVRRL